VPCTLPLCHRLSTLALARMARADASANDARKMGGKIVGRYPSITANGRKEGSFFCLFGGATIGCTAITYLSLMMLNLLYCKTSVRFCSRTCYRTTL
jgi:hypothetical protein